jgi:hypothetical protein
MPYTNVVRSGETVTWQAEYGVLSCIETALFHVVTSIENQESRHAAGHRWDAFSTSTSDRVQPAGAGVAGSARG